MSSLASIVYISVYTDHGRFRFQSIKSNTYRVACRSTRDDQYPFIHTIKSHLTQLKSLRIFIRQYRKLAKPHNELNEQGAPRVPPACVHQCVHQTVSRHFVNSFYSSLDAKIKT